METKQYTNRWSKYIRYMSFFLFLYSFFKGMFILFISIAYFGTLVVDSYVPIVNLIINIFVYGIFGPLVFIFIGYLFNDIVVSEQGLSVNFFWKKLLINWEDVLEIKPAVSFGIVKLKKSKIIITKSNLSFVHRFYGLVYGGTFQPSLLINSSISDFPELIKGIKKSVKKANSS